MFDLASAQQQAQAHASALPAAPGPMAGRPRPPSPFGGMALNEANSLSAPASPAAPVSGFQMPQQADAIAAQLRAPAAPAPAPFGGAAVSTMAPGQQMAGNPAPRVGAPMGQPQPMGKPMPLGAPGFGGFGGKPGFAGKMPKGGAGGGGKGRAGPAPQFQRPTGFSARQ